MKRHMASNKTAALSFTEIDTCNQDTNIQSSECALSELHLQSPKLKKISPVIKDFPKDNAFKTERVSVLTSPAIQNFIPPVKRKFAQRSPPELLKARKKTEIKNKLENAEAMIRREHPFCSSFVKNESHSILPKFVMETRRQAECDSFAFLCDSALHVENLMRRKFAEDDASDIRHSDTSHVVFTPTTPNIKLACEHASLPECVKINMKPTDKSQSCESMCIISNGTVERTTSSHNCNNSSMATLAQELGSLFEKEKSSPCGTVSPFPSFQVTQASPDMFSSPVYIGQSSSVQSQKVKPSSKQFQSGSGLPAAVLTSVTESLQPNRETVLDGLDCCLNGHLAELASVSNTLDEKQKRKIFNKRLKYSQLREEMIMPACPENKENMAEGPELLTRVFSQESPISCFEEESRAALTRVNTMINGKPMHFLLDPDSSPALLTEFPPPKEATHICWSDRLIEEPVISARSPLMSHTTPRSILQQRPVDHEFPFSKEPPSPIVLTRRRTQKFSRLFSDDSHQSA